MKRIVSVWLPEWPLDRLMRSMSAPSSNSREISGGVPDERPFALVLGSGEASGGRGQILHAVNAAGRRAGLAPGLSLADARAVVPGLATRPADLVRDRTALRRLALWAGRYGPRRNTEGTDGLWIDVTGVAHLFGGETAMMTDLAGRLTRAGIKAHVGLADTPGAAFALARYAPREREDVRSGPPAHAFDGGSDRIAIASPGATEDALATLPVEALRLPAETILLLKRLGLRRIGQLYDLPRPAVARRFREVARGGRSGARRAEDAAHLLLVRLDMALGHTAEPRHPLVEPPAHQVRHLFADPLMTSDGLLAATRVAMTDLMAHLETHDLGIRRVAIMLFRTDGTVATAVAGTSAPTRDDAHLHGLLAERIAAVDAGFGIDALVLEARHTEPMPARDVALAVRLVTGTREDPAPLFDRLAARFGAARTLRLAPVASHWPERAERAVPALAGAGTMLRESWSAGPPPGARPPRPPLVFPSPERIAVIAEVPDGPPARFVWRRVAHRVTRAEGPERIEPEWWRPLTEAADHDHEAGCADRLPRARDYYRIEDDRGGRFWVFREGLFDTGTEAGDDPPVWYLHGVFA